MLERQEQRALELAAFKEKTRSILKTFDVNIGDVQEDKPPLLENLVLDLMVQNVGVAFPLTHDEELELPRFKSTSVPVRAFLFSIKSIQFKSSHGETGKA